MKGGKQAEASRGETNRDFLEPKKGHKPRKRGYTGIENMDKKSKRFPKGS